MIAVWEEVNTMSLSLSFEDDPGRGNVNSSFRMGWRMLQWSIHIKKHSIS